MACVARVVSFFPPPRTTPTQQQQQRRHPRERGAAVGPLRATPSRRGWGETDSRFSRLDKRRDGENAHDDNGDTERNISFQELRKRQDREQRKVSKRDELGTFCELFCNRRRRRSPLLFLLLLFGCNARVHTRCRLSVVCVVPPLVHLTLLLPLPRSLLPDA
jgi:hypothetical protein